MVKMFIASLALLFAVSSVHGQIKGAGSTFAAQLYNSWSQSTTNSPADRIVYEPSGSTAGVKAVQEHSVDFGATDTPLSRSALDQAGLVQLPTAIGGVVMVANVPNITSEKIKLDGNALADIYTGRIRQWNHPALAALNPDLTLPALPIVPIFRDSGSGTSNAFTTYLSKVNTNFKTAVGVTSNLKLSVGKGGKTTAEMLKILQVSPGGMAYIGYADAVDLSLPMVQMKNQWGKLVSANGESLQLAMRAADWEKFLIVQDSSFEMDLTDAGCPGCWPMTTATYVLIPLKGSSGKSLKVLNFFDNAIKQGDAVASKEGYVPLPSRAKSVIALSMRRWKDALSGGKAK